MSEKLNWRGTWSGATVACIASGPSLNLQDCELLRAWQGDDRKIVAINTSYRLTPFANAIYGMDRGWWHVHAAEVLQVSKALRFTNVQGLKVAEQVKDHQAFGNSGAGGIFIAYLAGASRIILLGYDCKFTDKKHWHGNHPKPLGNAQSVLQWPQQFAQLAGAIRPTPVFNCSRDTALQVFQRASLEDCLAGNFPEIVAPARVKPHTPALRRRA